MPSNSRCYYNFFFQLSLSIVPFVLLNRYRTKLKLDLKIYLTLFAVILYVYILTYNIISPNLNTWRERKSLVFFGCRKAYCIFCRGEEKTGYERITLYGSVVIMKVAPLVSLLTVYTYLEFLSHVDALFFT